MAIGHRHSIKKCKHGRVISQCRCPDLGKVVETVACPADCPAMATDETDVIETFDRMVTDDNSYGASAWAITARELAAALRTTRTAHAESEKSVECQTQLVDYWRGRYQSTQEALVTLSAALAELERDREVLLDAINDYQSNCEHPFDQVERMRSRERMFDAAMQSARETGGAPLATAGEGEEG